MGLPRRAIGSDPRRQGRADGFHVEGRHLRPAGRRPRRIRSASSGGCSSWRRTTGPNAPTTCARRTRSGSRPAGRTDGCDPQRAREFCSRSSTLARTGATPSARSASTASSPAGSRSSTSIRPVPRGAPLHRQRRGRPAARGRSDGAADRVRARPAGARPDGVHRAAQDQATRSARWTPASSPRSSRNGSRPPSGRSRRVHRFPGTMATRVQELARTSSSGTAARGARCGRRRRDADDLGAPHRGAARLRRDEGQGARLGAREALRRRGRPGPRARRTRRSATSTPPRRSRLPGREARLQGGGGAVRERVD